MVSRSRITCVLGVCILALSACGCFTQAEWRRLWDRGDRGWQEIEDCLGELGLYGLA